MASQDKFSWKRFQAFIAAYGYLQTLSQIAVSFGITTWGLSLMPEGFVQPLYWAATGAMFFGTWAVGVTVVFLVGKAIANLRRWKYPPVLVLTGEGGQMGSVMLRHSGEPTVYSADGRIVQTLNDYPNPAPQMFQYDLKLKGKISGPSIRLEDGQWAHILLAGFYDHKGWFSIWRDGSSVNVPSVGVIVELTIKSQPPVKGGNQTKQYRVRAIESPSFDFITVEEHATS